jgi:hypothetical protein
MSGNITFTSLPPTPHHCFNLSQHCHQHSIIALIYHIIAINARIINHIISLSMYIMRECDPFIYNWLLTIHTKWQGACLELSGYLFLRTLPLAFFEILKHLIILGGIPNKILLFGGLINFQVHKTLWGGTTR